MHFNRKQRVLGLTFAALLSLSVAVPALADDTPVSTTVTPGTFSAGIDSATLGNASYPSSGPGSAIGSLETTVDDPREDVTDWATSVGWHIDASSTAFSCTPAPPCGTPQVPNIPATSFTAGTTTVVTTIGQTAAFTPGTGDLDGALTIVDAAVGQGNGRYELATPLTLSIPQYTRPATYSATLTVDFIPVAA